jgi:hypothetical protein
MRHIIYIFVIISLSFTVNAQLKTRSLMLEDEKQTSASVSKARNEKEALQNVILIPDVTSALTI